MTTREQRHSLVHFDEAWHIVALLSYLTHHQGTSPKSCPTGRISNPVGRVTNRTGAHEETHLTSFEVRVIGKVESALTDLESAPRQADEGAPEAWLVFEPEMLEGPRSIRPGDEVILITWLDRARRDVLSVHPRGDISRTLEGVFKTRSPHRPNPIGLHRVEITAINGRRVQVRDLEALDGTPIIDVKPILSEDIGQR